MGKRITKGLIADFDNTLVKTQSFIRRHLLHTVRRLRIKPPSGRKLNSTLRKNLPFEQIFTELFGEKGPKVLESYREDAMKTPYEAMAGAVSLIRKFVANGNTVVIVSNRANKLEERLTQAKFDSKWFSAIIQPANTKPDKRAYDEALKALANEKIDRRNIFVLGDSPDDFIACRKGLRANFYALTRDLELSRKFKKARLTKSHIVSSLKLLPIFK
jgi:HAD superfamily hydrolase (TIGR01549 family)